MPQDLPGHDENGEQSSEKSPQAVQEIDLRALAEKVLALMKEDLRIAQQRRGASRRRP